MSEKVVVSVKEGPIRGIKQSSKFSKTEFYSFFGIPYGKPPIGAFRFKDPVKSSHWRGVLDATKEKQGCVQFSLHTFEFLGTEDCLFNNIHIPKLPRKNDSLRPVIVNIHPGSFKYGSPHTEVYGSPTFIMHHDVVYVNISYRLHMLGFLNLEMKECSGNQGIKDIILSLRWINNNIRSFGGDPENITLLGCSSGSVLVHTVMLSPSAKGLFHKAVLMGAYLQAPSAHRQENNKKYAREVAAFLGYNDYLQDDKKILLFLKHQNPLRLIDAEGEVLKGIYKANTRTITKSLFAVTFDRSSILPDRPTKLVDSMVRMPVMIGFCQIECATFFIPAFKEKTEKYFKYMIQQNCFAWSNHLSDDEIDSIDEEVKAFYYKDQSFEETTQTLKLQILTDLWISEAYDHVINSISSDLPSSVFVYKFGFNGNIHTFNTILKSVMSEPIKGIVHASDFSYWNRLGDPQDKRTRQMVETFTTLVTTFARTGDPNYENFPVKWRSSTPDNPCYLSMNDEFLMIDEKLNNDGLTFWNSIKKKYHRTSKDV